MIIAKYLSEMWAAVAPAAPLDLIDGVEKPSGN
jgi:hypothetical protein